MSESAGEIMTISSIDSSRKVYLGIILEPVDDTLDALSQIYDWRIGEKVKVTENELRG